MRSNKLFTKVTAVSLITVLSASSLIGCGQEVKAEDLDLIPRMSTQEMMDYYAQGMKYDAKVTRLGVINETDYETYEVTGDTRTKLENLEKEAEKLLSKSEYSFDNTKQLVSGPDASQADKVEQSITEDSFKYIKATLNDVQLKNSKITSVKGALGYYFVDAEYTVSARDVGTFKTSSSLLGIHGAFYKNTEGKDVVNSNLLTTVSNSLNKYYKDNGLDYKSTSSSESISTGQDENNRPTYILGRTTGVNTKLINSKGGQYTIDTAYFPSLDITFNTPADTEGVSGIGIYDGGNYGLKAFKYNRENTTGTCKIRYAYKEAVDGSGSITPVNAYIISYNLTNGVNVSDGNVLIPDYLMTQLETIIDRSDRAQCNCDTSGLVSGYIYSDIGIGELRGYLEESTKITGYISKIRQVIARDIVNKAYLCEVETTVTEGTRDSNTAGTYKDTYYVVIQQNGTEFIISDMVRTSRVMISEPSIEADSATLVRLNALNLTKEVSNENKNAAKELLTEWYNACTFRILRGPQEISTSNGTQTLNRGMYDCFNNDSSMLSTDELEYIQSKVRNMLTAKGAKTDATYKGTVTEWVGGSDRQIELTTEELISYNKSKEQQYLKCYYLLSNVNDKWVIDQMTILDSEIVEGNQLESIESRINK